MNSGHAIRADLYRATGTVSPGAFLRQYFAETGFRYIVWMRLTQMLAPRGGVLFRLVKCIHRRMGIQYGMSIPFECAVGPGLVMPHFGGTFVHIKARVGKNCTLSHGVSIGIQPRGPRAGVPVIGDYVYISPGAKIIGNVRIGDHALIGVNAVVTFDVPDYGVVATEPAQIVSHNGSKNFIQNADYDAEVNTSRI